LYKRRCVKEILSLGPEAVSWPDEDERREIATRIERDFGWVNCIGTVDGTLFLLTYAPRSSDASNYKGRKHIYALTTMIVNDDKRKVRKYLSGFLCSAHDNRVYRSMGLSQTPSEFFGSGGDPTRYFLLGDSVFSNSGDSRGGDKESENSSDMAMELGEVGYSRPFLSQHDDTRYLRKGMIKAPLRQVRW
jgi:hypothetical protein